MHSIQRPKQWDTSTKLRHGPVDFVPADIIDFPPDQAHLRNDEQSEQMNAKNSDVIFIDSKRSEPLSRELANTSRGRSTSKMDDIDSDDEVVVFHGRQRLLDVQRVLGLAYTGEDSQPQIENRNGGQLSAGNHNTREATINKKIGRESDISRLSIPFQSSTNLASSLSRLYSSEAQKAKDDAQRECSIADYIANIVESGEGKDLGFTHQFHTLLRDASTEQELDDAPGAHVSLTDDDIRSGSQKQAGEVKSDEVFTRSYSKAGTLPSMVNLYPQLRSSDGLRANQQHRFVQENFHHEVASPKFSPNFLSSDKSNIEHDNDLTAEDSMDFESVTASSDADSSEIRAQTSVDVMAEFAVSLHEELDLGTMASDMNDEELARLLSKQEELGFGSDSLMLFDGHISDGDRYPPIPASSSKTHKQRPAPTSRHNQSSTSPLDQYDNFDIIDFSRPSLHMKPKEQQAAFFMEVSDPEIGPKLRSQWVADRMKKKQRKMAREEVRSQGLLNKHGKTDFKAKYKEGMSITEVKIEIRAFLSSGKESLSLPPMDKKARRAVHEIANRFSLRSKSSGVGKNRFPQLYRTPKTTAFNDASVEDPGPRFLPRLDKKGYIRGHQGLYTFGGKGRSGMVAGASYRDGEIVGGTAPELGVENRGRAMLEKMGWSTGTALGALNNKGILQPVTHMVKTNKAGLG
ncbi:hypothetical protein MMC25_007962 [Agyrium rufum]|nr:hypothetical protein [Agyrium rufum]